MNSMVSMQATYTPSPAVSAISCIVGIVCLVAMWKLFVKAGKPGWAAIIPFYNAYVLMKLAFGKATMFVVSLVSAILGYLLLAFGLAAYFGGSSGGGVALVLLGVVLLLVTLVIGIMTCFKLSSAFGQGVGFGFGLLFLNPIFLCILAFGAAQYVGANN